jgi:hypothetical protein
MSGPQFSVKECLRGYTSDTLGILCAEWALAASSKESRIRALEKVLQDPLHLERAAVDLEPEARRALALIRARGTAFYADLVSVPGLIGDGSTKESIDALARRGIVLVSPLNLKGAFTFNDLVLNGHAPDAGPALVIPEAMGRLLSEPPELESAQAPSGEEEACKSVPPPNSMVWCVLDTLRAVDLVEPRLTSSGTIHKSDRTRIASVAKDAGVSTEGLELGLMLTLGSGAVADGGRRLVTTPESLAWARAEKVDQVKALFEAYLTSDDLADVRLFYPDLFEALEEAMPEKTLRRVYHRRLAAEALRVLPPGVWHRVDEFAGAIRRLDENVFFLKEHWRALKSNAGEGSTAWRQRTWQSYEARFFAWYLRSLLFKLEMVELSESEELFRITPLGAAVLGIDSGGKEPTTPIAITEDEQAPALIVQADFEVVAYGDRCTPWLRRALDVFGERVQHGPVSTYRLTPASVYKGERSGIGVDTFLALLDSNAAHGIPGNVREEFSSWLRKLDSITLRRQCDLIEFKTNEMADAYAADHPDVKRIGERFVIESEANRNGYTHIDYARPLPPCLQEGEGLTFQANWDQLNLFVRRRLEDVGAVSEREDGGLEIELASSDSRKGAEWSLVVAELEALAIGPIAGRYRTALRAWSGEIGPALTRTATLVRFDEPEVCDTALEISEIAEQVEGRLGPRTLVVKDGCLNALKRAVKQHGVRVTRSSEIFDDGPPSTWQENDELSDVPAARVRRKQDAPTEEDESADQSAALPSYAPRIVCEIIEDAIHRRRPVMIRYMPPWSDRAAVRRVNPVTIDLNGAAPTMNAYCHTQEAARVFKLARIAGIRVLEEETF